MRETPRYCWDSCIWIDLIRGDRKDRVNQVQRVLRLAQKGEAELYTSSITLVEVCKSSPVSRDLFQMNGEGEVAFEDYIEKHVMVLNVSRGVGFTARNLQKGYPILAKIGFPNAIHIATCIYYNIHVLHTYDEKLVSLGNKLDCLDGGKLSICKPEIPSGQLEIGY